MRNFSVVAKLWLAFSLLVLAVMVPLEFTLNRLLTDFYAAQVTEPLVYHSTQLAATLSLEPDSATKAPMIARMVGGEVIILDPQGLPLNVPGTSTLSAPPQAVSRALAGESFVGKVPYRVGKEYIVTAVPIRPGGGAVVLLAPSEPLQRSLQQARRFLMLAGVGTLLLGTGLSFMLARSFLGPIVAIEKATERIASGDFSTRVPVTAQDEIGRLALAVNMMTSKLEAFEQRRKEFLANVAHELRTPLSYIRGYVQAVLDGIVSNPADREYYLRVVQESSIHLSHLVDDLMDIAQMDEGQFPFDMNRIDLRIPVEQAVATVRPNAQDKGVELEVRLPSDLPDAVADGGRIQQVMLNLLDNALRHTPNGGKITVSAVRSGSGVRIAVADTGPGIDPQQLPLVFERFHKQDGGGRGLGLAIVKSIVQTHGGTVGAESQNGRGSVFWFTVPAQGGDTLLRTG